MGMAKYLKQQIFCLILIILLAIVIFLFDTKVFPAEPAQKTFTLIINSHQVLVNLPDALPFMDIVTFADFTWDGELDPDDFTKWKLLKAPQLDLKGYIWVLWQNSDPNSPIKIVMGQVYIDKTLIMYRYFKYGVPYMFYLDSKKNKYVQYNFTDEEKNACLKCHQDKVKPPAILDEA